MSLNYKLNENVQYMTIYTELVNKCNTEDMEYDEHDVGQICNEVYQHELLLVFNVNDVSDPSVLETIDKLYDIVKQYINLNELIELITDNKIKIIVNETDKSLFLLLFSFDYFYLINNIIKQSILDKKVDPELFEALKNKIKSS